MVHADCLGGEVTNPRSMEAARCESYFLGEEGTLREYLVEARPMLINFKALRPHRRVWRYLLDDKSKRMIWACDAYLAVLDVTRATMIGAK